MESFPDHPARNRNSLSARRAPGVTHTTIQAAVDAAIIKRTNKRQYIAVMPGEYQVKFNMSLPLRVELRCTVQVKNRLM